MCHYTSSPIKVHRATLAISIDNQRDNDQEVVLRQSSIVYNEIRRVCRVGNFCIGCEFKDIFLASVIVDIQILNNLFLLFMYRQLPFHWRKSHPHPRPQQPQNHQQQLLRAPKPPKLMFSQARLSTKPLKLKWPPQSWFHQPTRPKLPTTMMMIMMIMTMTMVSSA